MAIPKAALEDLTLKPLSAAESLVAQGAQIMRIENDSMLAVAVQRPRDEQKVITGALKELELVPEEAAKAFYEIPYQETLPDGEKRTVKVSGPSIKAAMALARRVSFGHIAPSHALEPPNYEALARAIERTRGAKYVYLHRKAITKPLARELESFFADRGLESVHEADLPPLPGAGTERI